MSDATISNVFPVLNPDIDDDDYFNLGVEGTNFEDGIQVVAEFKVSASESWYWKSDEVVIHPSKNYLKAKMVRVAFAAEAQKGVRSPKQVHEITVTVQNQTQGAPASLGTPPNMLII